MKIRITCVESEVEETVASLKKVFDIRTVSEFYPNVRKVKESKEGRVYLDVANIANKKDNTPSITNLDKIREIDLKSFVKLVNNLTIYLGLFEEETFDLDAIDLDEYVISTIISWLNRPYEDSFVLLNESYRKVFIEPTLEDCNSKDRVFDFIKKFKDYEMAIVIDSLRENILLKGWSKETEEKIVSYLEKKQDSEDSIELLNHNEIVTLEMMQGYDYLHNYSDSSFEKMLKKNR